MTQDYYKMFQRAAAELRDESGGDGWTANTHTVQAPQEIHSRGHFNDQGILSHYTIYHILDSGLSRYGDSMLPT